MMGKYPRPEIQPTDNVGDASLGWKEIKWFLPFLAPISIIVAVAMGWIK